MLLLLAGPKAVKGRHLHPLRLPPLREKYVISNFASFLFFLIQAFYAANPICMFTYFLFFFGSLSIRKILLPPALSCLMSLSWRYVFPFPFCMRFHCHVSSCAPFLSLLFLFVCVCVYIYIYVHHHLSCVLFFCPPLSFIFCVP